MKESTGGALLMGLAAGIIIIFIILVAFFISYGKSFKIKNALINKIEQSEGMKLEDIENFLINNSNNYNGKELDVCYNAFKDSEDNIIGFNYEIIVYMQMDRTILGETFNPKIPIKGETKIIESGNFFVNNLKDKTSEPNILEGIKKCSASNGVTKIEI